MFDFFGGFLVGRGYWGGCVGFIWFVLCLFEGYVVLVFVLLGCVG